MAHGMRTDSHTSYVRSSGWRESASRYALLPLRIFLGVTFIYAGLDKLTDSAFMSASGAGSIGEMMEGVRDISAIPALVDLSSKAPSALAMPLPSVSWPSASAPSSACSPASPRSAAR